MDHFMNPKANWMKIIGKQSLTQNFSWISLLGHGPFWITIPNPTPTNHNQLKKREEKEQAIWISFPFGRDNLGIFSLI